MKNTIAITRKNATVFATYLPYSAYKCALELATAHKGEIGKTAEGNFKATFSSAKVAEKFKSEWTANYEANRKVEPTVAPTQKPKASKGKTDNNFVVVTVNGKEFLVDASALVPTKPTASSTKKTTPKANNKKSTTSSKKAPSKAKGKTFDYSVIKGKTPSDKNKALHAALVGIGMKDSRAKEYQAIWNARPWAK